MTKWHISLYPFLSAFLLLLSSEQSDRGHVCMCKYFAFLYILHIAKVDHGGTLLFFPLFFSSLKLCMIGMFY